MAVASLENTETKLINGIRLTRDQAIIGNQKLVKKIASKYEFKAKLVGLDFNDLVGCGLIGLIKAFDDFNDSLGYRFSTYAVPKIMGQITRSINKSNIGLYYPENVRRDADMIQNKRIDHLKVEEISKRLGINQNRVKIALEYIAHGIPSSIDMRVAENDEECSTILELVGEDQDYSNIVVKEFLKSLDDNEIEIIELRFQNKTLQDISREFGISRPAVAYHADRIKKKWLLYQYGLPISKTKKDFRKMVKLLNQMEGENVR